MLFITFFWQITVSQTRATTEQLVMMV